MPFSCLLLFFSCLLTPGSCLLLFGGDELLLLRNGVIYTMDPARPRAEALAIRGARIVAVGTETEVRQAAGEPSRVMDLEGKTVVPGLIDAHGHMGSLGLSLETLDLTAVGSAEGAARLVAAEAARRKPGEWILGRGWDQNKWPAKEFPTHQALSAAAPQNPVALTRVDGHALWVNRKAMDLADLSRSTADPPGGRILREPQGNPSGVLVDLAQGLVTRHIPKGAAGDLKERLARAAAECARLGLTEVHDAGVDLETVAAYRQLHAEGRLPLRVYAMISAPGPAFEESLKRGPQVGEFLTVRSFKMVLDGALGSRGAALLEPYADEPGNRGLLRIPSEAFLSVVERALDRGFQVNTHAIGDRANRLVLDLYEAAFEGRQEGLHDRRFRIEHAQVIALEDFPRFTRLGLIASIEATHATSDMPWAGARLGPERVRGAYAWQTLMKLGVKISNGSDFPVESANPLWGFYAAITRQDHQGRPAGGWFPDQRMSREEALRSFTLDAAYAAFEEKEKGSLAPGKLADLVVLSRDIIEIPPAEILTTEVVLTILGGKTVYQK